jgi:N-acetylglucosaminyldiphosphoundecaprenol N-acetyl-beta-D-mannosaminyltransferase
MNNQDFINILGFRIYTGNESSLPDNIKGVICTLNPHSYIISLKDERFRKSLQDADLLIPDGIGIVIASRILSGKKIKRITGSDLHRVLISYSDNTKGSCFYFGSGENTLNKIKERLSREHPGVHTGFFSPPFKPYFSEEEDLYFIKYINDFNPEILFVGMTAPRQEKWVNENRHLLNARIICPVGAVFDFYAGTVKRPGKFWLNTGLEWLPRLLREPKRLWQRTLISTPLFLYYVFKEKLHSFGRKVQRSNGVRA